MTRAVPGSDDGREIVLVLEDLHRQGRLRRDRPERRCSLKHDPEKWEPLFGRRSCSNEKLERDDDSKKGHPALAE
jgi:hypothetical protein